MIICIAASFLKFALPTALFFFDSRQINPNPLLSNSILQSALLLQETEIWVLRRETKVVYSLWKTTVRTVKCSDRSDRIIKLSKHICYIRQTKLSHTNWTEQINRTPDERLTNICWNTIRRKRNYERQGLHVILIYDAEILAYAWKKDQFARTSNN